MAVNDLVCLLCVCLMFSISCRIFSVGGWEKSSSRSESGDVLAKMTSSGWYDTSIRCGLGEAAVCGVEAVVARNMSVTKYETIVNKLDLCSSMCVHDF